MSYCRFSEDCDVYMYGTGDGYQFYWIENGVHKEYLTKDIAVALKKIKEFIRAGLYRGTGKRDLIWARDRLVQEIEGG